MGILRKKKDSKGGQRKNNLGILSSLNLLSISNKPL